ncbi:MAG TPA: hypothetical protein P5511_03955 [Candidatus Goldiibacteriota bacterium]|nr:hypothetical protein [Candidatus Goldiibacteriota bacterium]
MRRPAAAFTLVFTAISVVTQALFALCFMKSSDFDRFLIVKRMFENCVRLSSGTLASYSGITAENGAAIFTLPSIDLNLAFINGAYDIAIFYPAGKNAVFRLLPSGLSARGNESVIMKGINLKTSVTTGNYHSFSCCAKNRLSRSFYNPGLALMLPSSRVVFQP